MQAKPQCQLCPFAPALPLWIAPDFEALMNIAVFPGTFDPVTLGHMDIIRRAARLFDRVIVAVAASPSKKPLFSLEKRVEIIENCTSELENVSAMGFSGMLVDFLAEHKATVLIRGVRTVADYDYEMQLTGMYRIAVPDLEIVMLPSNGNLSFISSTLVREIIIHKGNAQPFVPEPVVEAIKECL